jgi:hypothetical protein
LADESVVSHNASYMIVGLRGNFNLGHHIAPPSPTPTSTPASTLASTPTSTSASTPAPGVSNTPTPTITRTPANTPPSTPAPGASPTPTPTSTLTATPPVTASQTPAITNTPTLTPTLTPTPSFVLPPSGLLSIVGKNHHASAHGTVGQSGTIQTRVRLYLYADGSFILDPLPGSGQQSSTNQYTGTWLPAGTLASDYQFSWTYSVAYNIGGFTTQPPTATYQSTPFILLLNSATVNAGANSNSEAEIDIVLSMKYIPNNSVTTFAFTFGVIASGAGV